MAEKNPLKGKKVFLHGLDGYHIEQCLKYGDKNAIEAVREQFEAQEPNLSYLEATSKAVNVITYHKDVSQGKGVGKGAHSRLKPILQKHPKNVKVIEE